MFSWLSEWFQGSARTDTTEREPVKAPQRQVPTLSPEEELAQSLERFRRDLGAIESRLYRAAKADLRTDEERIAKARAFVKEVGLDVALPRILQTVLHWPAWLSRPDAAAHVHAEPLGMSKVEGEEVKTEKADLKRIRFEFRERQYGFEFERETGHFEGRQFGKIRFLSDQEVVLCLRVTHDLDNDGEYWEWRTSSVEVLRPGEWAGVVLELEHAIRVHDQSQHLEIEAKYTRDLAGGLPDVSSE